MPTCIAALVAVISVNCTTNELFNSLNKADFDDDVNMDDKVLDIGLLNISSLRSILANNKQFQIDQAVSSEMQTNMEFYKATLVIDFHAPKKIK